jgi:isoleucyl-tRNA synthetase
MVVYDSCKFCLNGVEAILRIAMDYKKTLNLPKTRFPMKANLAQREPEILKYWNTINLYQQMEKQGQGRQSFVLHDGPPYANGHIHLGHAINKVLKDIIVKSHHMLGFNTPYVPGWDCHGLPIEHNVEKDLGSKRFNMDKSAVRKACRRYAEKFVRIQKEEFCRLGVLGDWDHPYLTMNYDYEASICKEFCRIFNDGRVFKSKKPVYWCPTCVTALAEAEVEYALHKSPSITVKFATGDIFKQWLEKRFGVLAAPAFVLIWTTTPWTLPANLAVALHPDIDYVAAEVQTGERKEIWITAEARLLSTLTLAGLEQKDARVLGTFSGRDIEKMSVRHPFLERDSLIIIASYVTLDTGTGCVHTAPGHGIDDYESGIRYGLDIYSPVDDHGRFISEIKEFAGENIFDANDKIIELLKDKGALVAYEIIEHSYPHCWRCKKPVIFRATAQWFISMDKHSLRKEALNAIEAVRWIPIWGKKRIYGMIEARPDWCISRQRAWGIPITVFICENCQEPLMDNAIADHLVEIFKREGSDAWFTKETKELLPKGISCPKCTGTEFRKEMDILDVWFDSGVSHAAVLEAREGLSCPAELYLEGSDQHRGWFQSSLLTSVATKHRAPYQTVLTHGFVVDGEGKKMSKSVGNVIPPTDIIKRHGAEVLRLWVSAEDYHDDIKISNEILQRLTESYRKIRNTIRYMLSNLYDFDPEEHLLDLDQMEDLDRWVMVRLGEITTKVRHAYKEFKFHIVFHQIQQFCIVDLSALYLDILKDRLYCEHPESRIRRSAQTAIHHIVRDILLLMAPILSFTAEEAWGYLPGKRTDSIFLASLPDLPAASVDKSFYDKWELLWKIRGEITKALELARKEKRIGLALDAKVLIKSPENLLHFMQVNKELLKTITIVSQLDVVDKLDPEDSDTWQSDEIEEFSVKVIKALGKKCSRCWTWSEDVGNDPSWPDVCSRCSGVLNGLVME